MKVNLSQFGIDHHFSWKKPKDLISTALNRRRFAGKNETSPVIFGADRAEIAYFAWFPTVQCLLQPSSYNC